MSDDREQLLQQRAYAIWETEGYPDGRDRAHWEQAERELSAAQAPEEIASSAGGRAEPVAESTGKTRRRNAAKPSAPSGTSRRKKAPELRP